LGDPGLDAGGVDALREVLLDTGALASVEHHIERLVGEALTALATTDVAEPARTVLRELVGAATARVC
jgi:geranylgeranyl diphosphate synthase type I